MNERIVNNNRTKFQSFLVLSTNCTSPPIQRIGNQPLECPPRPKRIKIPPHNQSDFLPKRTSSSFLYPPLFSLLAQQSPATLPSPLAALYIRRQRQPRHRRGAAALPLPRTAQPTKELLYLVSTATSSLYQADSAGPEAGEAALLPSPAM